MLLLLHLHTHDRLAAGAERMLVVRWHSTATGSVWHSMASMACARHTLRLGSHSE